MFFALFILAVFGALSAGLAVMWESEMRTRASGRDGLIAFYLAQAGIERAKIELANNEGWTGGGPFALGGGTYSVAAVNIACPPGPYNTCRQITSIGSITSGGSTLAERQIVASASLDRPPLDPLNTSGDEDPLAWSWREQ